MNNKLYEDLSSEAMESATKISNTFFYGKAVAVKRNIMRSMVQNIAPQKLIEFSVDEDFRLDSARDGNCMFSTCMHFSKMKFLLVAANQIVNYLDKI